MIAEFDCGAGGHSLLRLQTMGASEQQFDVFSNCDTQLTEVTKGAELKLCHSTTSGREGGRAEGSLNLTYSEPSAPPQDHLHIDSLWISEPLSFDLNCVMILRGRARSQ